MVNALQKWLMLTMASVFVIGLSFWILVENDGERVVEAFMMPVEVVGRYVTPQEWAFRGNALLGLFWFGVGIVFYGAVASTLILTGSKWLRSYRGR